MRLAVVLLVALSGTTLAASRTVGVQSGETASQNVLQAEDKQVPTAGGKAGPAENGAQAETPRVSVEDRGAQDGGNPQVQTPQSSTSRSATPGAQEEDVGALEAEENEVEASIGRAEQQSAAPADTSTAQPGASSAAAQPAAESAAPSPGSAPAELQGPSATGPAAVDASGLGATTATAASDAEEVAASQASIELIERLEAATQEEARAMDVSALPPLSAVPAAVLAKLSGEQLQLLVTRPGAQSNEALPRGFELSDLLDRLPEEIVQQLDVQELPSLSDMPMPVFKKLSLQQYLAVTAKGKAAAAEAPGQGAAAAAAAAEDGKCTVDTPEVCSERCFRSDFVTTTICDGIARRSGTVRLAVEDTAKNGNVGSRTVWAFLGKGNVDEVVAMDRACKQYFIAGVRDRLRSRSQEPGLVKSAMDSTPQENALSELYVGLANIALGPSSDAVLLADRHPAYSACKYELEFLAGKGLAPLLQSTQEVLDGQRRRRAAPPGKPVGTIDDVLAFRAFRGSHIDAIHKAVGERSLRGQLRSSSTLDIE